MKKLLLSLLFILTTSAIVVAQQESEIGLTIFPAISEYAVQPGETLENTINIKNDSSDPLPISISVNSLIPFDPIIDKTQQSKFDASSWIKFDETQKLLSTSGIETLNYKIDIPIDASPGGHYAQIALRQLQVANEDAPQNTNALIIPEVNALIFITVAGDINESLSVNLDNLVPQRIDKGSTHEFKILINNDGNVHSLPSVKLMIRKAGEIIETYILPPQVVLPNTTKTFEVEWLADEDFGKYQAQVEVIYSEHHTLIQPEWHDFTITPKIWQLVVSVLTGVFILLMIIRWRQLPRALSVLKGRAGGIAGSYKRSAGDDKLDKDKELESYTEIIKELERQKPILGLPQDEYSIVSDSSSSRIKKESEIKQKQTRTIAKTDELVDEKIKQSAHVSEELHPETHSKTVIIQTGSSTIVREEQMVEESPIVTEPKVTKIMVVADNPSISTTSKPKVTSKKKSKAKTKKVVKKKKISSKNTKTRKSAKKKL